MMLASVTSIKRSVLYNASFTWSFSGHVLNIHSIACPWPRINYQVTGPSLDIKSLPTNNNTTG